MPPLDAYPTGTAARSVSTITPRPNGHQDPAEAPLSKYLDEITEFTLPTSPNHASDHEEKWHEVTYWSCVTDPVQTYCGWHQPVLPGGDDISAVASRKAAFGILGVMAAAVMVGALIV
jgi:hypothetical protein